MALSWLLLSVRCTNNNIQHCDGFVMALSWLLLCARCTKKQYTTLWWLCHGFCSVSDVQKNNMQHCDGFVMASAQCQMYKKTIYSTVMTLSWLLLSVRCTKKQHTTLWWLCRGFCSVSDVQKNNIQHCDGFVVASAQCQMYKKTTYPTVMALSWLLLSVRCTKKQYTTLWWLCRGFCSVSDVQKNNLQHCDGFVMASAQCQMYKKTIYSTVMALSWLLLNVRCTKKQHTTLWWPCHGFCSVSDVQKNNIQHCDGFVVASAQCQMYKKTTYNTVMALSWLLLSVRYKKKSIYNAVMALLWLLLCVRFTKKQHTTLWWLCHGFCSVSDVKKNQYTTLWWLCSGFCSVSDLQTTIYNTVMALSWLLLCARCTKKQYTTLRWLCHGFCSVSDVQKNNMQHCDGFVMASAQCQMYKKTIYNTVMALSWLLLSVRCTKKQYTALWWLCRGFCSVSDVQKNNIQHCDGFVVASAQCQMYKKTIYNTVMALSWLLLSVRCTKKQHTTLWWLCRGFCSVSDVQNNNIQHCDGFVMASAQCQMYKKTIYNTVMALSWLLLSVRCTKKQHTTL